MATLRFIIECSDCSKLYRVRYGLGNYYPQKASFNCKDCSKLIELGYKEYGNEFINGAEFLKDEKLLIDNSLAIQNLHPEIPTNKEDESDPYLFQSLEMFSKLNKNKINLFDFQDEQYILHQFFNSWGIIEKQLRVISTKDELKLKQICKISFLEFSINFDRWSNLFLNGDQLVNLEKMQTEFDSISSTEIINYIKSEKQFLKKIYNLCQTYMSCRDQLQSTIFDLKYNLSIDTDSIVNVNWGEVNKVYGDLYEIIGDLFIFPTMINNVKDGRKFNEFSSDGFDLKKYLETDKANRGKNFENNNNLSFLLSSYHSWLRNGTHHNNSTLDTENNEIELGVGKGGGIAKKIKLIEYVKNCNELFGIGLYISKMIINIKNNHKN